jgi:hypothetical protein
MAAYVGKLLDRRKCASCPLFRILDGLLQCNLCAGLTVPSAGAGVHTTDSDQTAALADVLN